MKKLVTKEDRRGSRKDISDLADFVREKGHVDFGQVMMKFGWAHSKAYTMVKAVAGRTHPDIERRGTDLFHSPVEDG